MRPSRPSAPAPAPSGARAGGEKPTRRLPPHILNAMRLRNELGRLLDDRRRWGVVQPPAPGVAFVVTRLAVVLAKGGCDFASARDLARRLGSDPVPEAVLMREVRRASAEGRLMGSAWRLPVPDLLGEVLRVDEEERERLGLRLIGAFDLPALRDAGAKPKGGAKPWIDEGISRAAWYRRQSYTSGETVSSAHLLYIKELRTKSSHESYTSNGAADEIVSASVTFRDGSGSAAVVAAVAAGAAAAPEIAAITGLTTNAVKVALHRLLKAGAVRRSGRGKYTPAVRAGPDDEDVEDGPAAQLPIRSSAGGATRRRDQEQKDGRGVPPPHPRPDREAATPRTAGLRPAPLFQHQREMNTMYSNPTIELKIIEDVNAKGAIPRGRARYLANVATAVADELIAGLIESGRVRDLGDGWLGAWVPAVPAAGRPPVERMRLQSAREQHLEAEAAKALWERPQHLRDLAIDLDVTPHSARCALRAREAGGFIEREGVDTYMLTAPGLRLVALGEFS